VWWLMMTKQREHTQVWQKQLTMQHTACIAAQQLGDSQPDTCASEEGNEALYVGCSGLLFACFCCFVACGWHYWLLLLFTGY
jgi:hypothetical protein